MIHTYQYDVTDVPSNNASSFVPTHPRTRSHNANAYAQLNRIHDVIWLDIK